MINRRQIGFILRIYNYLDTEKFLASTLDIVKHVGCNRQQVRPILQLLQKMDVVTELKLSGNKKYVLTKRAKRFDNYVIKY